MSIDHAGITNLLGRYALAVATFDRKHFAACWATDAEWVAQGGVIQGIDRIVKVFGRARGNFVLCTQAQLSTYCEPDGEAITARTVVRETQWVADAAVGVDLTGIYTDRCVKAGDDWVFARRKFVELYRGATTLPGRVAAGDR